ncbi:MAG: hypothetical protein SVY41_01965 [Candidatus Nanohaloarchaea archaeon]|nr:hypothetical protein [Candidatus Nanohaloarchaea archaeon]
MPENDVPGGPDGPPTPEPVQCPICEKEFEDEEELAEHMEEDHGEPGAGV